jgi:hypothetical protein
MRTAAVASLLGAPQQPERGAGSGQSVVGAQAAEHTGGDE